MVEKLYLLLNFYNSVKYKNYLYNYWLRIDIFRMLYYIIYCNIVLYLIIKIIFYYHHNNVSIVPPHLNHYMYFTLTYIQKIATIQLFHYIMYIV